MRADIFRVAVFFAGFAFLGTIHTSAQQIQPRSQRSGSSAEGTLAVTATVVSSTGIVIGPDGQPRIIVANAAVANATFANAADPGDSASHTPEASVEPFAPMNGQKPDAASCAVRIACSQTNRFGCRRFFGTDVQIDIAQAGRR